MTDCLQTYLANKAPFVPFGIERLPLISQLKFIGFHSYKNRWAKRFGKKPGRLLFDFAYHCLKLSGQADVSVTFGDEKRHFYFDARKLHFSRIYDKQLDNLCEPELAIMLEAFLTGNKVFYDIGSNWGYFSMYAASLPAYSGPIHAFEPVKETYADLQDWVGQLAQQKRVLCHRMAISDSDGIAQMGIVPGDSGLASIARNKDKDSEKQEVTTSRLDSLKLAQPDFIKLDVEGYEFEVIKGGLKTLTANKPMIMFENWISKDNPDHTLSPIRALLELGYDLFVPMWWIGAPTNEMFWPSAHQMFPKGQRRMAYVPFNIETRFSLRNQINFFCCHKDRLGEVEKKFHILD